jgi:hypothetical protein
MQFLKVTGRHQEHEIFLNLNQVIYFEKEGPYSTVRLVDSCMLDIKESIKEIYEKLVVYHEGPFP